MKEQKPLFSAGLISGLNHGNEGCREGLWRMAGTMFQQEAMNIIFLIGGLVDGEAMSKLLKIAHQGIKPRERAEATQEFIKGEVEYLSRNIPTMKGIKIYIVTSPAYDKEIGEHIARGLAEKRHQDIRLYRTGGDRFEIRQLKKILGVYAPKKGVWMRGDYFDTPVLRVLKDEIKRSTRGIGDISAVGCHAVSVFHPGDSTEIKRPFMSTPALYKISDTRTSENQIGFRMLKFYSQDPKEVVVVTQNLKDLVSEEWRLVHVPPGSSKIQESIVKELNTRGPLTVGQLSSDATSTNRETVQRAVHSLVKRRVSKSWPGLVKAEGSNQYYFPVKWFQQKLEYPLPAYDTVDSFLGFGCLHAGCRHTDMKFFRDEVPKIMLENDVRVVCGAGDFIEGLKWDLMVKGEVYGSRKYAFNYTKQEQLAAYLTSHLISVPFRDRIGPFLKSAGGKQVDELIHEVLKALVLFFRISGNHCEWTAPLGFDALSMFDVYLKQFVAEDIRLTLKEAGLVLPNIPKLLNSRIIFLRQNQQFVLPSGITISLLHPYMSRTKTPSIRPQEMLLKAETQIVVGANFHTAEAVEQWEFGMGQRVCLQVGTIKRRSGFEDTKLKTVDFGIGLLKAFSKDKRIKRTEVSFHGTPTPSLQEANEKILDDFDKRLGL